MKLIQTQVQFMVRNDRQPKWFTHKIDLISASLKAVVRNDRQPKWFTHFSGIVRTDVFG